MLTPITLLVTLLPNGPGSELPAPVLEPGALAAAPLRAPEGTIWDRLKLYADGRLRAESTLDQTNGEDRHRGRLRFRFGGDYTIAEGLRAGARLTTLSDGRDANNPHWDFGDGDGFSAAQIGLDRLFLEWDADASLKLVGGKFGHTFARPPVTREFAWDDDVQPAGAAVTWSPSAKDAKTKFDVRLITAVATEVNASSGAGSDPAVHGVQANLMVDTGETTDLAFGTSYSKWTNLSRFADPSSSGNTNDAEGFGIWDSFASVTWTRAEALPVTVFTQYLQNVDDESGEDTGFVAGAQLGHTSGADRWNVFAAFYTLDANAIFAPVAQDDTPVPGSGTGEGMDGLIAGTQYFITENLSLRVWALTSDVSEQDDPYRVRVDLDFRVR